MRVLIVEDDAILGELLREYLVRLGHERVQVCETGGTACKSVEAETFDCAFVDLRLPDVDGVKLLGFFKQTDPGLPVVMMSGYPTLEYTIESMRKGASDFLTKPFTLQDVALTLERITKERMLLLENLSLKLESQARRQLEKVNRQLESKVQEQVRLFEISREIDEIRSSEDLYTRIVELAFRLTEADRASFCVFPPEQRNMLLIANRAAQGRDTETGLFDVSPEFRRLFDNGRHPVLVQPEEFERYEEFRHLVDSPEGDLSCWPLKIRGELFGFLMAQHREGHGGFPGGTEYNLLDFLVRKAALAIENMALYESLIGNFYGILKSLINALEAKDSYTGKHSERVSRYGVAIGRKVGCTGAQLEALQSIGYLHDIGKIGIKDEVLNKCGPLTSDEYELIKQHTTIGDSIVMELGLSQEERSIIRNHHERWDGKGYPDRLSGQDIPLLARVITIADAFDAMTSSRAYRKPMSDGAATAEIVRNRGQQFDPDIVDAFLEVHASEEDLKGPKKD